MICLILIFSLLLMTSYSIQVYAYDGTGWFDTHQYPSSSFSVNMGSDFIKLTDNDPGTTYALGGNVVITFNTTIAISGIKVYALTGGTGLVTFTDNTTQSFSFGTDNVCAITSKPVKTLTFNSGSNIRDFDITASPVDVTPPSISSVTPTVNSSYMAISDDVIINFSEDIQNTGSVVISNVNSTVTYSARSLRVKHDVFKFDTSYTVTVKGYKDNSGNVMSDFSYSFKTMKDNTPVTVQNIIPPPDAVNVDIGVIVKIQFNKTNIDTSTFAKVGVKDSNGNYLSSTKTFTGDTLSITMDSPLEYLQKYYIHIEGVKDSIGNGMTGIVEVSFSTVKDTTPLSIISVKPPGGNVPLDQVIEFDFTKNINPSSIDYVITDSKGLVVSSTKSVVGTKLSITPSLKPGTRYQFQLNTISDTNGNSLTQLPYTINFDTMNTSGNKDFDNIANKNLTFFSEIKSNGMNIIKSFIAFALIFLGARWLWYKVEEWIITERIKNDNAEWLHDMDDK